MSDSVPTIKGIFVNSHINALKKLKGESGINELISKLGKIPNYKNSENVPVKEEVQIIEICAEIMSDHNIPARELEYEAGRLHFRNFSLTPTGRIIFSVFRKNFKLMMLQTKYLAGHIFQGVKFTSEDIGQNSVKIVLQNNDYPLDHFKGLFSEWMEFSGYTGTVNAKELPNNMYEYLMNWK